MAVAASDIQADLVLEIGDTPDGRLAGSVASFWARYADKALVAARLQELYTKRSLIDVALASLRNHVDTSTDGAISIRLSQREVYLKERRAETLTEITRLETIARANRAPQQAALTSTELETPPFSLAPDANAPIYRGDPYYRDPVGSGGLVP